MSDPKGAWDEVADRLSELGLKLKLHLQQAGGSEGDGSPGAGVKDALNAVSEAIDRSVEAIGAAVKDEAVREDTKDVGRAVVDALEATFSSLGDRFRSHLRGGEEGTPPPGEE